MGRTIYQDYDLFSHHTLNPLQAFTDIFLADLDQIIPQLDDESRMLKVQMRETEDMYWRGMELRRWVEQKYCDYRMSHRRHLGCGGRSFDQT